jgi:serine/threonine protein kinase
MEPVSIKGYRIFEKIKDGSIGTVWKGQNKQGETFAIKQISSKLARDSAKIRLFKKEAELTKSLSHPNIIKVHEYVEAQPQPFFVMEYFESENLKWSMAHAPERLHKKEFQILMGVADALSFVHTKGVVHKDIKPENVLISPKSDVRLIDFSLAQSKWDRFLQFGKKVEGTPMYMAPEQIRGEKCDARTDIYSFGAMMYELLTKHPPFMEVDTQKLLQRHLKDLPATMRKFVPTIEPELDSFVLRLLEKKPDDRFANMNLVMQQLSRWLKQDTVVRLRQVVSGTLQYPTEAPSAV